MLTCLAKRLKKVGELRRQSNYDHSGRYVRYSICAPPFCGFTDRRRHKPAACRSAETAAVCCARCNWYWHRRVAGNRQPNRFSRPNRPWRTWRNLSEADQLAIALVSLANQERVLIIEIVREGMVSPGVAQAVLSNTEALAEAARSEGRIGYESASDDTLSHRIGFHVALFLYRRLGLVRMLADRLAERLEILLIMRIALGRLVLFNSQIAKLFGEPIAVATREIVSQRQQAIENALEMLRRQYPDYLTELEVRFLTQSTLHHEMNRYQSLFEEGLISHELYEDLKRNTLRADLSVVHISVLVLIHRSW